MSGEATDYIRGQHDAVSVVQARSLVAGQLLHDAFGGHHPIKTASQLGSSVKVVREDGWVDYFVGSDTMMVCAP